MGNPTKIKSMIFVDMEATGLPGLSIPKSVQCTEISLVAIHREHFDDEQTNFRVINKLNLCIQPKSLVQPTAVTLTGLDNNNLETQKTFSATTAELLLHFLNLLEKPICLLAHNGLKFDFPLLKSELKKADQILPGDVLFLDTYLALLDMLPPVGNINPALEEISTLQVEDILNNGRIPREASETTPPHEESVFDEPTTPKSAKQPVYLVPAVDVVDLTKSPEQNKGSQKSPAVIDLTSPDTKRSSTPSKYPFPVYSPEYVRTGNEVCMQSAKKAKRTLFPATEDVLVKKSAKVKYSHCEKDLTVTQTSTSIKHGKNKLFTQYSKGYKLEDLYKQLFGAPLPDAHTAEADTVALMKVCHRVKDFSTWMDEHALSFDEVPAMW